MDKLKRLNEIEIVDFSCSGGEVEYVLIENTEENISILKELGMTEEDRECMVDDDEETIDIACFAFNKLNSTWWSSASGFQVTIDSP